MNPNEIEKTLKRIIEIDEATVNVEKNIRKMRSQMDKEIKQETRELDLSMMKKARRLGKVERELILKEAAEEVARIEEETVDICEQMQKVSNHHLNDLVDEVFKELIEEPLKIRSQ